MYKDETITKVKKILYVEDDDINRKTVRMQLRNSYEVDLAENGKKALELFSTKEYDLILMDINLGVGMNGTDVLHEIRKMKSGKNIPIVAITAYAMYGEKEKFLSSGFDNYISKPYFRDDLLKCIIDTIEIFG